VRVGVKWATELVLGLREAERERERERDSARGGGFRFFFTSENYI